jgi:spore coat protein U-like protein
MLKKSILHVSVAVALLPICAIAFAATDTTNIAVSATVSQGCSISTISALAFGAYDPIVANATAPLNATGVLSVACAKGATGMTIAMNDGLHGTTGQRRMQKGTVTTDVLLYNIFQPPSNTPSVACAATGTIAWNTTAGTGVLTLSSSPSKAARLYNVCGTIPPGQDATTGEYTDTVIATLNF